MPWIEWYNALAKPSWTPAPATIGLIWQILYPIILVSFGFVFAHPIRLVGGIQARSGGIQGEATRACAHLVDASGRHRPGGAVYLKEVNAATVTGRQIHLGWQHIAQRRTECSDIGDE